MQTYKVLVEVLKPAFAWVEVHEEHPQDAINSALELSRQMRCCEFADRQLLDSNVGQTGMDDVISPLALIVIDKNGVQQYNRIDEIDSLHELSRISGEEFDN